MRDEYLYKDVSTHSRPKAAGEISRVHSWVLKFQHTAARRRLGLNRSALGLSLAVSTHSRPKAAGPAISHRLSLWSVSTHSRPKAAGGLRNVSKIAELSFNTQPPEGGWLLLMSLTLLPVCFNTQPPEGGWDGLRWLRGFCPCFNTQPPEGGWAITISPSGFWVWFQHTAARRRLDPDNTLMDFSNTVSTHSRPKAAGPKVVAKFVVVFGFQHTAARRRLGRYAAFFQDVLLLFQHTAARRRLARPISTVLLHPPVSTHSRPKAAGRMLDGDTI